MMTPPAPWLPSALAFATTFALASLVSGVTYWLARLPWAFMRGVRILFCGVAALLMLFVFVGFVNDGSGRHALLVLLVVVGASAVQATIERNLDGETLTAKQRFVLCFFSSVWDAAIVCCFIGFLIFGNDAWLLQYVNTSPLFYRFGEAISGYALGFLIAPLSISFYRRVFQTLALRPGFDRVLRQEERAH